MPSGSTNAARSPKRAAAARTVAARVTGSRGSMRCPELNTAWPSASASSLMARLRNVLPTSMAWPRGHLAGHPERAQRGLHRRGRLRRDGGRDAVGGGLQLARRGDLGDQADLEGAGGADALVVADQRHPQHLAERHAVQHLDRLEHRRHAVGDVRVEERGVLGGDDDVDLAEQVERAAAGHAVHGRHHRLPALVGARAEAAAGVDVGERVERVLEAALVGRHLVAVDARAERLVAGGGEHDRPHRRGRRGRATHTAASSSHIVAVNALCRSARSSVTVATPSAICLVADRGQRARVHRPDATSGSSEGLRRQVGLEAVEHRAAR